MWWRPGQIGVTRGRCLVIWIKQCNGYDVCVCDIVELITNIVAIFGDFDDYTYKAVNNNKICNNGAIDWIKSIIVVMLMIIVAIILLIKIMVTMFLTAIMLVLLIIST